MENKSVKKVTENKKVEKPVVAVNVLNTFDEKKTIATGKSELLLEIDYNGEHNAPNREQVWIDVKGGEKGNYVSKTPYHVFTGTKTPNFESVSGRVVNKGIEKKTCYATLSEALKSLATKVPVAKKKPATEKKETAKKAVNEN